MTCQILDNLLDLTIILSYTKLGYQLRKHWWHSTDLDVDMSKHVCLVTGASSGLGLETTKALASLGAKVTMLVRNRQKGELVRSEIMKQTGNHEIFLDVADMSQLASIRTFVKGFVARETHLDVFINNAGALMADRQLSVDGYELSFATNILGPFLLTNLLLPLMKESAPSRIINVSSGGMYTQKLDMQDLQFESKTFNGVIAYAQAKRAQVILTEMWAKRLRGTGVTVNAMHPGWVNTPGLRKSLPGFWRLMKCMLRTPVQGADTIVWLACAKSVAGMTGKLWFDRHPRPTHLLPWTRSSVDDRQMLWDICVKLSGLQEQSPVENEG